jgi:imidazolonepropionase-like amidohydrolase
MQPLFLQHGVTTVRDVGSHLDVILIHRRRSQKPGQQRPRLFACGPIIDGLNSSGPAWNTRKVATADEARAVARELLARQVDCLKVAAQLTPPQVQTIVEEAAPYGVPVTAQVGTTNAVEAVALGVTGLERTLGVDRREATTQELQAQARLLATKGVVVVPTLVLNEQLSRLLEPDLRQDARLQPVPSALFDWWDAPFGVGQWTEARSAEQRGLLSRKKARLAEFVRANGRVVAGSATPYPPYILPGAGLQRELELLVEAGLTPLQAISAATKVAAEFLGQDAHLGTLEVGKLADLVILGGNPLTDIRQVRQVEIVLRDGQTVWKK